MLESVSLQKNRLRSGKNVIFSLLCILVDRPMGGGGLNTQHPPLRKPLMQWKNKASPRQLHPLSFNGKGLLTISKLQMQPVADLENFGGGRW